jgi:putative transposase
MGIDENRFACSPTTVYRVLSEAGLLSKWQGKGTKTKGSGFKQPLVAHQEWHTDIKFINFKGTFLFFISVMDGYSLYIVHHELRHTMNVNDVEIVIQRALEKYTDKTPKIISDNGSQYISRDFQMFLKETGLRHVRTSPSYPQSNGKIERFHRSLEEECVRNASMINIKDARNQLIAYVDHYNNMRLHSALNYLRPIDYLENDIDELLKIRQYKMDKAAEERRNYWESKSKNNVV